MVRAEDPGQTISGDNQQHVDRLDDGAIHTAPEALGISALEAAVTRSVIDPKAPQFSLHDRVVNERASTLLGNIIRSQNTALLLATPGTGATEIVTSLADKVKTHNFFDLHVEDTRVTDPVATELDHLSNRLEKFAKAHRNRQALIIIDHFSDLFLQRRNPFENDARGALLRRLSELRAEDPESLVSYLLVADILATEEGADPKPPKGVRKYLQRHFRGAQLLAVPLSEENAIVEYTPIPQAAPKVKIPKPEKPSAEARIEILSEAMFQSFRQSRLGRTYPPSDKRKTD